MAWLSDLQHVPTIGLRCLTTTISNLEVRLLPYITMFLAQVSDDDDGNGDGEGEDD